MGAFYFLIVGVGSKQFRSVITGNVLDQNDSRLLPRKRNFGGTAVLSNAFRRSQDILEGCGYGGRGIGFVIADQRQCRWRSRGNHQQPLRQSSSRSIPSLWNWNCGGTSQTRRHRVSLPVSMLFVLVDDIRIVHSGADRGWNWLSDQISSIVVVLSHVLSHILSC